MQKNTIGLHDKTDEQTDRRTDGWFNKT